MDLRDTNRPQFLRDSQGVISELSGSIDIRPMQRDDLRFLAIHPNISICIHPWLENQEIYLTWSDSEGFIREFDCTFLIGRIRPDNPLMLIPDHPRMILFIVPRFESRGRFQPTWQQALVGPENSRNQAKDLTWSNRQQYLKDNPRFISDRNGNITFRTMPPDDPRNIPGQPSIHLFIDSDFVDKGFYKDECWKYMANDDSVSNSRTRPLDNSSITLDENTLKSMQSSFNQAARDEIFKKSKEEMEWKHSPRLSNATYRGLCLIIGTATEVEFRRETVDTVDDINIYLVDKDTPSFSHAGSYREGFRLPSSDLDYIMFDLNDGIIDISKIQIITSEHKKECPIECDTLMPGYVKLKSSISKFEGSRIIENGKYYLSSSFYRKLFVNSFNNAGLLGFEHGPCFTFKKVDKERDFAFCLKLDFWPDEVQPWAQRCIQKGWPTEMQVDQIVNSGFYVAAIGSCSENDTEWRISFSDAELRIIYSFNHCQFLCYGLLKLFIKEVINVQNSNSPLCSYFLKTTLFWVIQNDRTLIWTPDNFLHCFWNSFKLLIHRVYTGYCPHFFIPENNLFKEKVIGHTQSLLFDQLYGLYNEGAVQCILMCPSMLPHLGAAFLDKTQVFETDEKHIWTISWLEMCFFKDLSDLELDKVFTSKDLTLKLDRIELLLKDSMNPYRTVTLQYITARTLHRIAMSIQDRADNSFLNNRDMYMSKKTAISLLKLSCTIGNVSEILYLAMYYYRHRHFKKSIMCLNRMMLRMRAPYTFFYLPCNHEDYQRALEGMPLTKKMKKGLIDPITLQNVCTYIHELALEQKAMGVSVLYISPLVMLLMLLILNYHRLGNSTRSFQYLQTLNTLLRSDDREYIKPFEKDLSWQILGICQQTCGYHFDALRSFLLSLRVKKEKRERNCLGIRPATYLRMLLSIFLYQRLKVEN